MSTDLAMIYDTEPRVLMQAVKRNVERFPPDFMFQLTREEWANLKSQSVIPNRWGGARTAPYAFTEHGAVMLASVLNSRTAVEASIAVVRAFVWLRQVIAGYADLARKVAALEKKYDGQFAAVFNALRQLMAEPAEVPKPRIGYATEGGQSARRSEAVASGSRKKSS